VATRDRNGVDSWLQSDQHRGIGGARAQGERAHLNCDRADLRRCGGSARPSHRGPNRRRASDDRKLRIGEHSRQSKSGQRRAIGPNQEGFGRIAGDHPTGLNTVSTHREIANLAALKRSPKHVAFTRNRITRICQQCGWKLLRDITADGFTRWRAAQGEQSPKTLNEYYGQLSAFFTWLERKGHLTHHPLKSVTKVKTRGQERFKRRALAQAELDRLIEAKGGRGLIYFLASYTGLRRGEIKALLWADLHLECIQPFIKARAATTKNQKEAMIPMVRALPQALQSFKDAQGRTHREGLPQGHPDAAHLPPRPGPGRHSLLG